LITRSFILLAAAFYVATASGQSAITLRPAGRTIPFRITISPSAEPTVLEASTNLNRWIGIATNAPNAAPITITDSQSAALPRRFYRIQTLGPPLSDLTQVPNDVFMPPDGFNALQYAPNGKLGFIVWRGKDLLYRERNGSVWREYVVGTFGNTYAPGVTEEYRFQPLCALLFDSASRAHILRLSGNSVRHHVQQATGAFAESAAISLSALGSTFSLFDAAIGPRDALHIAVVPAQQNAVVHYGSNKPGAWQWSSVAQLTGNPRGFWKQSYAPRWFSLAVDSQNYAHITFCPQFQLPLGPEGYYQPNSELHYASNRGGTWTSQRLANVPDLSGDAGHGASVAIGPNDQPAIAAWYNERWRTGSSDWCQLHYYTRDAGGAWSKQIVASNADGYLAGDGDKGTGFAPYLRFDSRGRPHVAFLDDAAQHFPMQNEYAGNLRHAWYDGANWITRTVYRQTAALERQIVYPAMAVSEDEMTFIGLDRHTVWQTDRIATSTYYFFSVQAPLP
jgi:hypothetical protein